MAGDGAHTLCAAIRCPSLWRSGIFLRPFRYYSNEKAPSDATLGAVIGKYIQAIGFGKLPAERADFDALLEVKLLPLSMPSNGFPCARPDIPGTWCSESTSRLTMANEWAAGRRAACEAKRPSLRPANGLTFCNC